MDDKLVKQVTLVVRKADEEFEVAGGTSRHWVRDHFLPHLEIAGLMIIPKPEPEGPFQPMIDQLVKELSVDQTAGSDCPHCGKKGTVFRCPNRNKGGHWNDGSGVICYICINCTMCDVHGTGCSPLSNSKEYWEATPEISQDLYNRIKHLYDDSAMLLQIRLALGLDKMWKAVLDVDGCTAQGHTEPGTCSRCGMEL